MNDFLKQLSRNVLASVGGCVILLLVLLAILTPWLGLADPAHTDAAHKFIRPFTDMSHLLGTDQLGRDLLSRLMWGTRLSLIVGICASLFAAVIGSLLGVIAGYAKRRWDNTIMRGIDMLMAFPYILLALAIVAALGPGLINALLAVAIVNIPFFARNIRGVTVGIVNKEYIEAARLSGMNARQIILTEIVPNVVPVIVVAMSTTIGWMILETAGLSFLGLGSQPPQADLGSMLGQARSALIIAPFASVVPGAMIFVIVMCINLFGDGIRDVLDPRLRSGALSRPRAATTVQAKRAILKQIECDDESSILSLHQLSTEFQIRDRSFKAVNQIDLQLVKGQCLGLIGESGSGKSVTALSVTKLVASPPGIITGGDIQFQGQSLIDCDYQTLRHIRGNRIAYIFQDPLSTLHPLLSIGEQMVEAIQVHDGRISKKAASEKALELLNAVYIPNAKERMNILPFELSGGMRQRVAIAMALVNDPDLIIADEPTTALDVTVQGQILALLNELREQRQLSLLFITHDFGVVAQLCDQVAVMYAGKIVETGPVDAVLAHPAHPYTRRLIACVPKLGGGKRHLPSIDGLPPVVDQLPKGCAFAPRCDKAQASCQAGPTPEHRNSQRSVLCRFPEEVL